MAGMGLPSLGGFAAALLGTIRGWRDEALKHTPGFRDRIVQVKHTAAEGGLNLNMKPEAIAAMSASGVEAAEAIIRRFLHSNRKKRMAQPSYCSYAYGRNGIAGEAQASGGGVDQRDAGAELPGAVEYEQPPVADCLSTGRRQRRAGQTFWSDVCAASAATGELVVAESAAAAADAGNHPRSGFRANMQKIRRITVPTANRRCSPVAARASSTFFSLEKYILNIRIRLQSYLEGMFN